MAMNGADSATDILGSSGVASECVSIAYANLVKLALYGVGIILDTHGILVGSASISCLTLDGGELIGGQFIAIKLEYWIWRAFAKI